MISEPISFYFLYIVYGYFLIRVSTAPISLRTNIPISSFCLGIIFILAGIYKVIIHYQLSNYYFFLIYRDFFDKTFVSLTGVVIIIIILLFILMPETIKTNNNPLKKELTLRENILSFIDAYLLIGIFAFLFIYF